MSAPGGQQGGSGGSNGGPGDQGNQGNPAQSTTSTTSQGFATSTSSLTTFTSPTSLPTQSSTASPPHGINKIAIIAGVIGGIGALLALSLVLIWFLNRRKKTQMAVKNGTVQPVTYAGLNSSFAGVPFGNRPNRNNHDSLTPAPLLLSPSTHSSNSDVEMRGHATPGSAVESDMFLPTYAESQAAVSIRGSLGPLNTSHSSPSSTVSPMSAIQTPSSALSELPPVPPLNLHRRERDTMGFPIEPGMASPSTISSPRLPPPREPSPAFEPITISPEMPTPIVSPTPRHPLIHQDSLERQVRQGMTDSPEPAAGINPARLRVLSQEMPRESPILGLNNVRIQQPSSLNPSASEINRMASQRTVSSINSMPPIVSDAELENLGVGVHRAR